MTELFRSRPVCAGLLFVVIGVAIAVASFQYPVGTLTDVGPGYLPMAIGVILAALGGVTLVTARPGEGGKIEAPTLRPIVFITASLVSFALLIKFGLFVASFALLLLAVMARREVNVREFLLLYPILAGIVAILFVKILNLQIGLWP